MEEVMLLMGGYIMLALIFAIIMYIIYGEGLSKLASKLGSTHSWFA